jgi:putative DNA methylase
MIPRECRRLAEVDFPIAQVSKQAAREKSIRHGHPSTLHLWWARRPLASSRAVLLALLLPDPCDPACPAEFKEKARAALPRTLVETEPTDAGLRASLLNFIADFADWNTSTDSTYLKAARTLVRAAHGEESPLVVDPFSGGGSIPYEALRLDCEVFASDLNPVACLVLSALLEKMPIDGPGIAEQLRAFAKRLAASLDSELGAYYKPDSDGSRPIAYLWARTVRCEAPNCGSEIPLVRSFWLGKKRSRMRALRLAQPLRPGDFPDFDVFEPKKDSDVMAGTVLQANGKCLACQSILPAARVRAQLQPEHGGADVHFDNTGRRVGGARLLAVVLLTKDGRRYRPAMSSDYTQVWRAQLALRTKEGARLSNGLPVVPNERIVQAKVVKNSPYRFHLYGSETFGDILTARQKLLMVTLQEEIRKNQDPTLSEFLAIAADRVADRETSLCRWDNSVTSEVVKNTFARQALSVVWDFAEVNVFSDSTGSLESVFEFIANVAENGRLFNRRATVQQADAEDSPLPDACAQVWFTDPPYYDAVSYADLSDFFFVWMKRSLPGHPLLRDPYDDDNNLTPKAQEAVQDEAKIVGGKPKDKAFFETKMAAVFGEGRRILAKDGIGSVVFAHKTTEGWEALLAGMVRNGWVITASWPLATEMGTRLRARDSAALATSIHLVCRPRGEDAPVGDWADVARELPIKVRAWMDRLDKEGVRGADLVFACIGPAMEVYSRYSKVVDAEDREIPLGGDPTASEPYKQGYLAKVWEVVGRLALEQVLGKTGGAGSALEEDARLTALFLWALQSTNGNDSGESEAADTDDEEEVNENEGSPGAKKKGYTLPYDVVRRFAQPLGIHLETWEGRIAQTEKGVVRLLPVTERAIQLFGKGGVEEVAEEMEAALPGGVQITLFPDEEPPSTKPMMTRKGKGKKATAPRADGRAETAHQAATTLDRVHAAMLLQAGGQTGALRTLLGEEKRRSPDFERLANALAALYPRGTEERRLVEAMLLAMPR